MPTTEKTINNMKKHNKDLSKFACKDSEAIRFKKYNADTYKASYVDCSSVVIAKQFNLDYVVSLDKFFEKFEEITLFKLN